MSRDERELLRMIETADAQCWASLPRWWIDSDERRRAALVQLLARGVVEIVGGRPATIAVRR